MALNISIQALLSKRLLWIDHDLVWEGIRLASGDWRYMVFIPIYNANDLHRSFVQRRLHCSTDFDTIWRQTCKLERSETFTRSQHTRFGPRSCDHHLYHPFLPADFFLCPHATYCPTTKSSQPSTRTGNWFPSLAIKELHCEFTTNSSSVLCGG